MPRTPTTVEVSECCRAGLIEDFRENPADHHDPFPIYRCKECKLECDVEDVCEICLGKGEYVEMGKVVKCSCKNN